MPEFVIVNASGQFLAGPRQWSAEYPDARVFDVKSVAIAAARRTLTLCDIVEDYGCETQRVIDTVEGKAS